MDFPLLFIQIIFGFIIVNMLAGLIAYLILLERKAASWMQDRIGPNRVGPHGLWQPIVDGVKFILKEEFIPAVADRGLFILAPMAILTPALCGAAIVPWGGMLKAGARIGGAFGIPVIYTFTENWSVAAASPAIGVLWVLAMAGLATYGVVLAGYASGSKYSFFGGLRATAQMLSYEVPMALAIMAVVVVLGSLDLNTLISDQARYSYGFLPHWNVLIHPIAFMIFVTCIFAESNRTPFDLPECESELVGGYHTEYSSMKFALFFLGEYSAMITGSAIAVGLFLGGWHLPWLDQLLYGGPQPLATGWLGVLLKFMVYWGKVVGFVFFYMWIRWTLPRFRFDQLMNLAWRGMIPLALGAFLISAFFVYMSQQTGVELTHAATWIALTNVVYFAVTLGILGAIPKKQINKRIPVPNSRYNPTPLQSATV